MCVSSAPLILLVVKMPGCFFFVASCCVRCVLLIRSIIIKLFSSTFSSFRHFCISPFLIWTSLVRVSHVYISPLSQSGLIYSLAWGKQVFSPISYRDAQVLIEEAHTWIAELHSVMVREPFSYLVAAKPPNNQHTWRIIHTRKWYVAKRKEKITLAS